MTSLFEHTPLQASPIPVTELVEQGGRGLHLLEFFAFDVPDQVERESEPADQHASMQDDTDLQERARQARVMVDAARDEAWATARADFNLEKRTLQEESSSQFAAFLKAAEQARRDYFAQAERQVVELALAVARRVLCREAEADRMHLLAIVRVALSKVQDGSQSTLRVPVGMADAWRTLLRGVEVIEDEGFREDALVLETSVGVVELGMREQLAEIERSFAELMMVPA